MFSSAKLFVSAKQNTRVAGALAVGALALGAIALGTMAGTAAPAAAAVPAAQPLGYYAIGSTPDASQIAQWSISIKPDGSNLPPGSGTVDAGATVYSAQCAMCHGTFGEGEQAYPKLVGGVGALKSQKSKTVGSYWPYAPIVFDYINRAMPFYAPRSLTSDQVYAISAYILNLNGIVPDNFVADAKSLAAVKMPNRDGFNFKDPRPLTHDVACMAHCAGPKPLTVTSDASKSGITPRTTGGVDTMQSTPSR